MSRPRRVSLQGQGDRIVSSRPGPRTQARDIRRLTKSRQLARTVLFLGASNSAAELAMRNVRVMNIPVGVLAAWILLLGYVLWAAEAVGSRAVASKAPCAKPVVEATSPVSSTHNS